VVLGQNLGVNKAYFKKVNLNEKTVMIALLEA